MINIKKGLDLPISGKPSSTITDTPTVNSVSLLSNDFVGMKPTMLVKVGDKVKVGSKIFEDKKNTGIFFYHFKDLDKLILTFSSVIKPIS